MMVSIFLSGAFCSDDPSLNMARKSDFVIGADGGWHHLQAAQITPQIITGDFDSSDPTSIPTHILQKPNKSQDSSDFEKALSLLPEGTQAVHIFGGLGGRHDHFLNNLLIAANLPPSLDVIFHSKHETWRRATKDCALQFTCEKNQTISLLPFTKATVSATKGLKWNLTDTAMGIGQQLGLSNVTTGNTAEVHLSSGILFVAQNH